MTKATAVVVVSILVAITALIVWLRYEFGSISAVTGLLLLFGVVTLIVGWLLSLATQRATLNAIVDFQAADDRGEVARANMWRELIRGQNKMAIDDNKHALRNQPQLSAPAAEWTWTDVTQQAALPARGSYDDVVIDG